MESKTMSSPIIRSPRSESIDLASVLALAFLVLLAAAAIVTWQIPAAVQSLTEPLSGERFLAQNPELSVARRYAAPRNTVREEWFLARNPELTLAARYVAEYVTLSAAQFLAQNPELKVNAGYDSPLDDAAYLSQNPELSAGRRYTELYGTK